MFDVSGGNAITNKSESTLVIPIGFSLTIVDIVDFGIDREA